MSIFTPELRIPKIYAYTTARDAATPWKSGPGTGLIKVGYTTRDVTTRIREQLGAASPDKSDFRILGQWPAITGDGKMMTDRNVHEVLELGLRKTRVGGEWFECTTEEVEQAIESLRTGIAPVADRPHSFTMRPEQRVAVERTAAYFRNNPHLRRDGPLRFLWNAKMRFGKTFTTYKLAQEMGWTKVLVLTYKPAVEGEWRRDLDTHVDFQGWSFIGNQDAPPDALPEKTVWFSSFQSIFAMDHDAEHRLNLLKSTEWDAIILDEYHYGAGTDLAREVYADSSEPLGDPDLQKRVISGDAGLRAAHHLYLSGTPFRALHSGEFLENQIYSWTYTDEQRAKRDWKDKTLPNPYEQLPQMVMMTYKLPEGVLIEAVEEELNLDQFFRARRTVDEKGKEVFLFDNERVVSLWLDFITGVNLSREEFQEDNKNESPMPYADPSLSAYLNHALWYLPSISACKAMARLISSHKVLRYYEPVVAAGPEAGIGSAALPPVQKAIKENERTITLSCGKLTTGVTVPEWTAVFMLRSLNSPESYFQTAFRAQSPGIVTNRPKAKDGEPGLVMKDKCFLFDFDPRRALSLAAEYCYKLDQPRHGDGLDSGSMDARIAEFLDHLPVLCHENGTMYTIDPGNVIDIVTIGVGSAMLARRFNSVRMVSIAEIGLERLLEDDDLMSSLSRMESFRNLNQIGGGVVANQEWRVKLEGKEEGPFKKAELLKLVREGELTQETLVKGKGVSGWKPAGQVPQLETIFPRRSEWFLREEEDDTGPFRIDELRGLIDQHTLVRKGGEEERQAREYPELKKILRQEKRWYVGLEDAGPFFANDLYGMISHDTLIRREDEGEDEHRIAKEVKDKKIKEILDAIGKPSPKEVRDLRDNLVKFIARLPVFMYLNDEREKSIVDVIETADDGLFEKVTGITKEDFNKLKRIGVFKADMLNPAILAFKRVEDGGLEYLGDRRMGLGETVAAWDGRVERENA